MTAGLGIAPDAYPLLGGLAALALALLALACWRGRWGVWVSAYALVVVALAVAFFFRDPERSVEPAPDAYLSPADGRVLAIDHLPSVAYMRGPAVRISIFLSVLDVHVQRSPVAGVVEYVEYRPGRFAAAWSETAERENEHTIIGINAGIERVMVRQVAGTVARRVVTYVGEGDAVAQGERIGLIRFGSRVEAFLPADADVLVEPGDRVVAGSTLLARSPATPEAP